MGSWKSILFDIYIVIRAFIQGYWYLYLEVCSSVRPLEDPMKRENEYAVITGGNRGIGWSVAKALVRSGMKVIIGCRDGASKDLLCKSIREAQLPTESIEWINLDLASMNSVRLFAQTILQKQVPISLLINNAGKGSSPYAVTEDGFESLFAINYLGHFLLTHMLMPRLLAAGTNDRAARIVNVSSATQALGWLNVNDLQAKSYYNEMGAYSQSKCALIIFTKVLHRLLARNNKPVKVYAVHPGIVKTTIWNTHWLTLYAYTTAGFLFKTEEEGAQRILHTALSREVEDFSGKYFEDSKVVQPAAVVRDHYYQKKLWEQSCQLVDISEFGDMN